MIDYDSELRHHHRALCRVLDVQPQDRVLDIGCGTGQTTRHVARIATDGRVFGVDIARSSLQQAQQLTLAQGMRNVGYVCGDAAQLPLPEASIDVAISRFGTMFFVDPVQAFTNVRATLRPMGRLVMMVWQTAARNAWSVAIHRALSGSNTALPDTPAGPSAFSLGDEPTVRAILHDAAFVDVALTPIDAPVLYGADTDAALAFVSGFSNVVRALEQQTPDQRERTLVRLRDTMAAHQTHAGVAFDSLAWIVTARRD